MATAVAEVTDGSFEADVLAADRPVLVDFYADWCQPCKRIAPVVEQVAAENADRLRVGKLDIQANMATAQRFGVMSVPTLILFKAGRPVLQLTGANDARDPQTLLGKLAQHLA